jgi:hypothetical protein
LIELAFSKKLFLNRSSFSLGYFFTEVAFLKGIDFRFPPDMALYIIILKRVDVSDAAPYESKNAPSTARPPLVHAGAGVPITQQE